MAAGGRSGAGGETMCCRAAGCGKWASSVRRAVTATDMTRPRGAQVTKGKEQLDDNVGMKW